MYKASANEIVRACTGLDVQYNAGEQEVLNPKGVNLIRAFPWQGIRVWGAHTCCTNAMWNYVIIRRLFIYMEESLKVNINWVIFEPNDETLWLRVKRTVEAFLTDLWRNGALAGSSTNEAFYVDIGKSTMRKDDIDNHLLIMLVGVATVKTAEFSVQASDIRELVT